MMRTPLLKFNNGIRSTAVLAVAALLSLGSSRIYAHCDGTDGPVVQAAQKALAESNVNLVLIWVQKSDEAEIKDSFAKALAVRKLNAEAQELADRYFFETLVRVHRAGEGAPYTGLKPAGHDIGVAIPAADRALKTGDIKPLHSLITKEVEQELQERFHDAVHKKKFNPNDIAAGREFVGAYVNYVHLVEGLHQALNATAHGHADEAETSASPQAEHNHNH
jgi:hypothetical protein